MHVSNVNCFTCFKGFLLLHMLPLLLLRKYILSYILLCLLIFLKRISNSRLKRILWITLFSSQGTNLAVVCVSTLTAEFLLYQFPLLCQLVFYTKLLQFSMVGSNGIEPSTSRLSGVRSNHLSYEPINNTSTILLFLNSYMGFEN